MKRANVVPLSEISRGKSLPTNLSFNAMEEFVSEVSKSMHNWGTVENFVASDFPPLLRRMLDLGLPILTAGGRHS